MWLALASVVVVVLLIYGVTVLRHPRFAASWNELTADGMEPNDWMIYFRVPPAH